YTVGEELSTWHREANGFLSLVDVIENGEGGVSGLDQYALTALSPDGTTLYVAAAPRLMVFARDALAGTLTLVQTLVDGQGGVSGLSQPTDLALSPDGEHLYVSGGR